MTSLNGTIFGVTGPLCGEFTGPGEFPAQRPVTRSFDVFFDLRLNNRLSKQPWGWWFETPPWWLWRHCNDRETLHVHAFDCYLQRGYPSLSKWQTIVSAQHNYVVDTTFDTKQSIWSLHLITPLPLQSVSSNGKVNTSTQQISNPLRSRQNGLHFADGISNFFLSH